MREQNRLLAATQDTRQVAPDTREPGAGDVTAASGENRGGCRREKREPLEEQEQWPVVSPLVAKALPWCIETLLMSFCLPTPIAATHTYDVGCQKAQSRRDDLVSPLRGVNGEAEAQGTEVFPPGTRAGWWRCQPPRAHCTQA